MPFTFSPTEKLPDVVIIQPRSFDDDRGWFMETYKNSEFATSGIPDTFRQDNHSRSEAKGVIRGLHYQMDPAAQGKLVRVLVGGIYDVAVDIRRDSPTFGEWVAIELSAENRRQVWVPPGFAHGFCTRTDVSEVAYKATNEYSPEHDRAIRWNDPTLAIEWPTTDPLLSDKDANAPALAEAENNFRMEGVV